MIIRGQLTEMQMPFDRTDSEGKLCERGGRSVGVVMISDWPKEGLAVPFSPLPVFASVR